MNRPERRRLTAGLRYLGTLSDSQLPMPRLEMESLAKEQILGEFDLRDTIIPDLFRAKEARKSGNTKT